MSRINQIIGVIEYNWEIELLNQCKEFFVEKSQPVPLTDDDRKNEEEISLTSEDRLYQSFIVTNQTTAPTKPKETTQKFRGKFRSPYKSSLMPSGSTGPESNIQGIINREQETTKKN